MTVFVPDLCVHNTLFSQSFGRVLTCLTSDSVRLCQPGDPSNGPAICRWLVNLMSGLTCVFPSKLMAYPPTFR